MEDNEQYVARGVLSNLSLLSNDYGQFREGIERGTEKTWVWGRAGMSTPSPTVGIVVTCRIAGKSRGDE
jgi:hypothetical protein